MTAVPSKRHGWMYLLEGPFSDYRDLQGHEVQVRYHGEANQDNMLGFAMIAETRLSSTAKGDEVCRDGNSPCWVRSRWLDTGY